MRPGGPGRVDAQLHEAAQPQRQAPLALRTNQEDNAGLLVSHDAITCMNLLHYDVFIKYVLLYDRDWPLTSGSASRCNWWCSLATVLGSTCAGHTLKRTPSDTQELRLIS
jgi:hypothetical protein